MISQQAPLAGLQTALERADAQTVDTERLREQVHTALEEAGVETPTRPASAKLTHDQTDLLVDLLEGFSSRREILEWEQELVIQTVGQLEDSWFTRVASDAPTVSALLGEPWGEVDGIRPDLALEVRRGIVAKDLLPAFHAAHEVARWSAVERVDHLADDPDQEDMEPIEPRDQEYPLMRPAFGEIAGQQEAALGQLLEGFESPEQLLAWALQVVGASYAEIERETITQPYFELPIRRRLVADEPTEEDMFIRESWAAEYLLPAFNRAADALADRTTEVTAGQQYRGESGDGSIT
ncbi:hypothetical protein ACOZ4F_14235 [Haloarcula marismortui]|uniref:hypothetical protein n=1 Tax=Haloarcula marismortui TaxID=2238 RepID=UPI003C79525D